MTTDDDDEVRDWATFALGSLCHVDTPQVRETLLARVSDENADVRGEALVGLATRGDRRATPHISAEIKRGCMEYLILEAAEEMLKACPDEDELRQLFTARR